MVLPCLAKLPMEPIMPILVFRSLYVALSRYTSLCSADSGKTFPCTQSANVNDVSILTNYPHLQYIDLNDNKLGTCEPLAAQKYLVSLNVSMNKMTELLDFNAPDNLREVDYSFNLIKEIGDVSGHRFLRRLNIDDNHIGSLSNVNGLKCLQYLSARNNQLETLRGLEGLPLLELHVSGNRIALLEGVAGIGSLQIMNLENNILTSLNGLGDKPVLTDLLLATNNLQDIDELNLLQPFAVLSVLDLRGNPMEEFAGYRDEVIYRLPRLTVLDAESIDFEEKVGAELHVGPGNKNAAVRPDSRFTTSSSMSL